MVGDRVRPLRGSGAELAPAAVIRFSASGPRAAKALSRCLSRNKRFIKNEWEIYDSMEKRSSDAQILGKKETLGEGLSLDKGSGRSSFFF